MLTIIPLDLTSCFCSSHSGITPSTYKVDALAGGFS